MPTTFLNKVDIYTVQDMVIHCTPTPLLNVSDIVNVNTCIHLYI